MTRRKNAFDHSGSSFDSFLEEEGILQETEAIVMKRVIAWQFERAMKEQHKTKQAMARELRTSRSQLDRLLDPRNVSVSLETITRAAKVLGKHLVIRIADSRRAARVAEASTGKRSQASGLGGRGAQLAGDRIV